jgi:hypothetical protein
MMWLLERGPGKGSLADGREAIVFLLQEIDREKACRQDETDYGKHTVSAVDNRALVEGIFV